MTPISSVREESVDSYLRSFSEVGFLRLQAITSKVEAAYIREVVVGLFANEAGATNGDLFDTVASLEGTPLSGPSNSQTRPSMCPSFLKPVMCRMPLTWRASCGTRIAYYVPIMFC
jgi:hypothetical protein